MNSFNFVIFGFTSNLAQLKIIPALYDLEEKGELSNQTKIIGIGRKDINVGEFVNEVLHQENRHHIHDIKEEIKIKLVNRITYLKEDFEHQDEVLYQKLKQLSGNNLYYLATYPNLYEKIFKSLKDNNLNISNTGWVRIMIEKPIDRQVNKMIDKYFEEEQIYRVDHYLGKESLRKLFGTKININDIEKVEAVIFENFGIGKRGIYYDAVGSLIDMGQNHLLQMIASVFSTSNKAIDREIILKNLDTTNNQIFFGQYKDYLEEENIPSNSNNDTFFILKTYYNNIPVIISSGKYLNETIAKVTVYLKNSRVIEHIISPLTIADKFDPYERLIIDAIIGDQSFFNSQKEIEYSWDFIDKVSDGVKKMFVYDKGSNLFDTMSAKFSPQS